MKTAKYMIAIKRCALNLTARILILFLLVACSAPEVKIPNDIIPRDSMVSILTDVHLVEGARIGRKIMGDTLMVDDYYAKIYSKYGITAEGFKKSFRYYNEHPEMMKEIYKEVVEHLNQIEKEPPRTPLKEEKSSNPNDTALVDSLKKHLNVRPPLFGKKLDSLQAASRKAD